MFVRNVRHGVGRSAVELAGFDNFKTMRVGSLGLILAVAVFGFRGCRSDRTPAKVATMDERGAAAGVPAQTRAAVVAGDPDPAASDAPSVDLTSEPGSDRRPVLVCFGDSLTAGFGTDPGQSYPDDLQRDLDAAGYKYRVVNAGVSGNTTKDGVGRIDRVLAMHPAVVVVEFGGNDGLRGLPIADSRANLDEIVRRLKAAGTQVALAGITLPPDYGPDYIRQFNETYTVVAKKYKVPLLPFLLQGVYGVNGMMQPDRTHATAQGNAVVAQSVMRLLAPMLKK